MRARQFIMHTQPIRRLHFDHMISALVLEKTFKQTGMAAASQKIKEFIPILEWDLQVQVGTHLHLLA